MNNKHVEGTWNEAKGNVKETIGHATGNNKLEGEGVLDRIKGKVEQVAGDVKDAVKDGIDHVLDRTKSH